MVKAYRSKLKIDLSSAFAGEMYADHDATDYLSAASASLHIFSPSVPPPDDAAAPAHQHAVPAEPSAFEPDPTLKRERTPDSVTVPESW